MAQYYGAQPSGTGMIFRAVLPYIVMACCAVSLIIGVYFGWKKLFPTLCKSCKDENDACTESYECKGYTFGAAAGLACCEGKCLKKIRDTMGDYWCPHEAKTGGPQTLGQSCTESLECVGYTFGSALDGNACCKGKCTAKVKDYANSWWCPHEAIAPPKTKGIGTSCRESSECAGYTFGAVPGKACCKGKCTQKVKDHAGAWYCPHEAIAPPNTKGIGAACRESFECAGYKTGSGPACCKGRCTQKVKDWAGTWWCPK